MALTERSRTGSRRLLDVVMPQHADAPDTSAIVARAGGSGLLAALVGLALAVLLTVSVWALSAHQAGASAATPVRLAAGLWLLAHHVTLEVGPDSLGLTPMTWALVPLGLTYLAGRQTARALSPVTIGDVGRALAVLVMAYGLACAVVAGVSGTSALRPHALQAFVLGALAASVGGGLGLLRASGLQDDAWFRLPVGLRRAVVAGSAALLVIIGSAAVLVAVMLAVGFGDALDMTRTLSAGAAGGAALAVITISFVPNLVVWAASVLVGPGFSLGVGTQVSPQAVDYGAVPVFPPLAALPPEGRIGGAALLVLCAPIAAGLVSGWLVQRDLDVHQPHPAAAWALVAGLVAGAGFAFLAWWASGPVAGGRLAVVGVSAWVGLLVAVEIGLVGAAVAWESHRRRG